MNDKPRGETSAARLRHRLSVRLTHWLGAVGVTGLFATDFGILISHPRLYWGETGTVGMPSLIDLPLPFIIGPSVWNRPIHFFFAWILVLTGIAYYGAALCTRHLREDLLPAKGELSKARVMHILGAHLRWRRTPEDGGHTYNIVQKLSYLAVIFVIVPAILWTGLAMSPALMTAFPFIVTILGGHQSARTLHFLFVLLLLVFVIAHLAMLFLVGFRAHVRAMITGSMPGGAP